MGKVLYDWSITIVAALCAACFGWALNNFVSTDDDGVFIGLRKRIECREVYRENKRLIDENEKLALEVARLKRLRPLRDEGSGDVLEK